MVINTVAYPKVNLHLAVGPKRQDGYHELASIFQLVKDPVFNDKLIIKIEPSKDSEISITGLGGVADSKNNTIYKAISAFLSSSGLCAKVSVDVKKGIPSQTGLGGGSSDAGSTILALNSFYPLSQKELLSIALEVGSDVPFFVANCEAAVVTGRGENVFPIEAKQLRIKLYPNENEKMSTAKAYQMLDSRKDVPKLQSVNELKKMYERPISEWQFYNDFEIVNTPSQNPLLKLTGSGTCRYMIDLL